MNKTKSFLLLVIVSMFLGSFSSLPVAHALGNQITLEELGMLQLAAHDLFNVDRGDRINPNTATDFENGKLDLSTLFIDMTTGDPFSLNEIALGGEPRNRENIILFSVASDIGQHYVDDILDGKTVQEARQNALNEYHDRFNSAFESAFGETVPNADDGCVTMTENLAFRTVHDFLPGNIWLDRNNDNSVDSGDNPKVKTLDFTPPFDNSQDNPLGHTGPLTFELAQDTSDLNGDFDPEFNNMMIIIPPIPPNTEPVIIIVDLEAADFSFGEQFNTYFGFGHFMQELEDGSYHSSEDVMIEIRHLIAKGYGPGCHIGGESIPIETTSLILAGAQSFTWMIPLLASGIGFGFFIFLKKP